MGHVKFHLSPVHVGIKWPIMNNSSEIGTRELFLNSMGYFYIRNDDILEEHRHNLKKRPENTYVIRGRSHIT